MLLVLGGAPALTVADAEPVVGPAAQSEPSPLTPAQLDQLLAPIALYPDPLVAILLPASTVPTDIVLAARFVAAGGPPETFDAQNWDDSVKALARYPDVLKWMDQNLDWTRRVGAAFLAQPAEVMNSTQRLRAAARAAGNLVDTPEHNVLVERDTVRIVPARRDVVYVPVYDSHWVYRPRTVHFHSAGPVLRFSSAYHAGPWLSYYCDWDNHTLLVINRVHRVNAWRTHPRWVCPSPATNYVHVVRHSGPAHARVLTVSDNSPNPASRPTRAQPSAEVLLVAQPASPGLRPATPSNITLRAPTAEREVSTAVSPREEQGLAGRRDQISFTPPAPSVSSPPASPVLTRRSPLSAPDTSADTSALQFRARPAAPSPSAEAATPRRESALSFNSSSLPRESRPTAAAPASTPAAPSSVSEPRNSRRSLAEPPRMPARTPPASTPSSLLPTEAEDPAGRGRR